MSVSFENNGYPESMIDINSNKRPRANLTTPSPVLHTVLQEVNAMPNSTRLDKETEDALKKAADYLHMTKSDIVRKSVRGILFKGHRGKA